MRFFLYKRSRHLAEWRLLFFTMIVTVNRPMWKGRGKASLLEGGAERSEAEGEPQSTSSPVKCPPQSPSGTASLPLLAFGHFPLTGGIGPRKGGAFKRRKRKSPLSQGGQGARFAAGKNILVGVRKRTTSRGFLLYYKEGNGDGPDWPFGRPRRNYPCSLVGRAVYQGGGRGKTANFFRDFPVIFQSFPPL